MGMDRNSSFAAEVRVEPTGDGGLKADRVLGSASPLSSGGAPTYAFADEAEMVRRMSGGDQDALDELVGRLGGRVRGLVRMLMGDHAESEDVVQETFWQAWREASRYRRDLGSPAVWLLRIARSRAIDHLRQRRSRTRTTTRYAERAPRVHATIAPPRERHPLEGLLRDLPPDQRQAIVLAFVHGLSRDQIARVQRVPVGTVKTRIGLGLGKLRTWAAEARLMESTRDGVDTPGGELSATSAG